MSTSRTSRGRSKSRRVRKNLRGVVGTVTVIVAVLVVAALLLAWWLSSSLNNVVRAPINLPDSSRIADTEGTNILLLGADSGEDRNGSGSSILADADNPVWPAGKNRSDATMLVHIDEDEKHVYVVSFPRDSYVTIYDDKGRDRGKAKINAALSLYGPGGAIATVENLTKTRIDHIAMTDWDGFETLTDELGGVSISIDGAKPRTMNGEQALAYVRERKHLPGGDFDRVKRQQNFLRAIATSVIERGLIQNPIDLKRLLDLSTSNLAVDEDWSNGEMRSFIIAMRNIKMDAVNFMTVPTTGTANDPVAGSIVVLDDAADADLYTALRNDSMQQWVDAHPETQLGAVVH